MTRKLGTVDGAALVIASVVGAGIFTVPAYVAALGGSLPLILALWASGGLMALAGALSYAELATRLPRGGAEYVYLREAFGPTIGFLSGWTSFVAGFSGAIAAAAVGFAHNLVQLVPSMAMVPRAMVGVALIALFTVVTLLGLRAGRLATNLLTLAITVGIAGIALAGFVGAGGQAIPIAEVRPSNVGGLSALSALVPIFFTYSGWNAAAYVAGDFHDPRRTVPQALILGTVVVALLYLALNAALLRALPVAAVAGAAAPVSQAAEVLLGGRGGIAIALLVLVALASSVCALIITGARIYREMAADGALPAVFARTTHDGVPAIAVIAQSAWSCTLVLTGTFAQIVTYTGFSIMVFSAAAVLALFVLRRRHGAPSTYRVPWYPVVPIGFLVTVAAIAISSFRYAAGPSVAGVGVIAIGYFCSPHARRVLWRRVPQPATAVIATSRTRP